MLTFRVLMVTALLGASLPSARAATIAVVNPGFESVALAEETSSAFANSGTTAISGWSIFDLGGGGGGQTLNPGPASAAFPGGAVPEGNNTALAQSAIVQQALGTVLTTGTYSLSIRFGNPADRDDMATPSSFQLFSVPTGNVIFARVGIAFAGIADGTFADFSASTEIMAGNVNLGDQIGIKIVTGSPTVPGGTYYAFDDVRLTLDEPSRVVPVPAAWAMFCGGVGLLGLRLRKRAAG
ncbi:MAG: hypothetical protein H7125_18630 [Proteobacteria bacterium]|nr:hypothetical protein [Burkholderiales bacterium]